MARRKKKRGFSVLSFFLLILLAGVALGLALLRPKPDPAAALNAALAGLVPQTDVPDAGVDAAIARAYTRCFRLAAAGPMRQTFRNAAGAAQATVLDVDTLGAGLADEMQPLLEERADAARSRAELYTEDGSLQPALAEELYTAALEERLSHAEDYCRQETLPVSMDWTSGGWTLPEPEAILTRYSQTLPSRPGFEEAVAALDPVAPNYTLPRGGPGPVPDSRCYGETADPQDIVRLLESDTAQRLINGQALDFDPERDMLGRTIYYYLDESILALVWQQDEHGAIGTFAEVFIADASQLRRKIADDSFGVYQFYYASELAAQANAVLACSGDFYNNGRGELGIFVYEGKLMRAGFHYGQTCMFDGNGDMLFVYENGFADAEEAQRFIDRNHVDFSLSWGPVLIDHGEDVTPYDYIFGEVRDTYARCAVGQLGERHYLMMTINCESPDHYYLVTLRQAADSMIAHGCYNAYTLDGGQTASILIGGRLINPVQFGAERLVSDIFYFATALPAEDQP